MLEQLEARMNDPESRPFDQTFPYWAALGQRSD